MDTQENGVGSEDGASAMEESGKQENEKDSEAKGEKTSVADQLSSVTIKQSVMF